MARKAKEILLAMGYTEADLVDSPILKDPRFVAAIEKEDAAMEAKLNGFQTEVTDYKNKLVNTQKWYQETAVPTIEKALKDATAAKAERARLEAQLKAEQEYGLRRVAAGEGDGGAGNAGNGGDQGGNGGGNGRNGGNGGNNDPDYSQFDSRYVSSEVFRQTAENVGVAIAMAQDVADDHMELFGKRLPGGVTKLRSDYLKARNEGFTGTMADYASKTYKFDERRAELATQRAAEERANLETEIRAKILSEMGNPMTAPGVISRSPFYRKIENGAAEGGRQPWDGGNGQIRTREQRHADRVVKFGRKVLEEQGRRMA